MLQYWVALNIFVLNRIVLMTFHTLRGCWGKASVLNDWPEESSALEPLGQMLNSSCRWKCCTLQGGPSLIFVMTFPVWNFPGIPYHQLPTQRMKNTIWFPIFPSLTGVCNFLEQQMARKCVSPNKSKARVSLCLLQCHLLFKIKIM